ncbi:type VI secretion system lipoprotein TssJ [Ciceribacter sp. L1K23]|uniref:type VI secretion system lipoprotein TssJ n=1 Tax=unclassified Ciceribacter TaxID=2628820 RepID=UPI001ABDD1F6|nr:MULTISPECIES: type VI secretion system lipoprotein TssJ [unclassified Ciceribacter]MBO3761681.1 type VI secretion system lipoprotein TssJ [Ciceribacter sp. L1K22]MBR0558413.1 type VI secretion system lipoprotein TssJ [Ciceribacter sp. L1K23]
MNQSRRSLLFVAGLSLTGVLAACSGLPKPTPVDVSISADANVNPGDTGEPSPVVVRIYELKGIKAFNNASFFDFDDDAKLLGADLISSREYELTPGSERKYDTKISSEAAYIGVVVSFRNIQSATWRDSIELRKSKQNRFMIYITSLAVRIQKYSRFTLG